MNAEVVDGRRPFIVVPHDLITDQIRTIGPSATCVYLFLVKSAGLRGTCYPSAQTIADALGMSEKTVRTAISTLKDAGMVRTERRSSSSGNHTTLLITVLDTPGNNYQNADGKNYRSRGVKITAKKEKEEKEKGVLPKTRKRVSYSAEFEAFWDRTWKVGSKVKAQESWSALDDEERQVIAGTLASWTAHYAEPGTWQKHVVTWINERLWETAIPHRVSKNGHVQEYRGFKKQDGSVL